MSMILLLPFKSKVSTLVIFSKNKTQTAVTNMMRQRISLKNLSFLEHTLFHHVCYRSLCYTFTEVEMAEE